MSPAQIQQIASTVTRTPEVMVKVLPAGANSVGAVRQHLAYVGRQGDVELLTDNGQRVQDRNAAADLVEDWDLDLAESQSGLGGSAGAEAGAQTRVFDAGRKLGLTGHGRYNMGTASRVAGAQF